MENQYKKTFPDLMVGKKIIYVHGFMSAGSSHTVQILRDYMPEATVIAPDLPIHPEEAMELLNNLVDTEKPDLIIGTSMGGMYTEMLYGVDRICVNPAFQMGTTISETNMMGKQVFQNPRQDGIQEVIVTKALVKEYKEITEKCFSQVTEEEQQRVFGLFGDADPVVHTFDLFSEHYSQAIHFMVNTDSSRGCLPLPNARHPMDCDRQEGRERRTVLIDQNTLADGYGKPKSSLNKAYEFLLDNYNVFFACPAPTNNPSAITEQQAWIEDTFMHLLGTMPSSPTSRSFSMATTLSVVKNTMISSEQHCFLVAKSSRLGRKLSLSLNA